MGIAPRFEVDRLRLDAKFKALQRRIHPDRFAQKSAQEREIAHRVSSLVNVSYAMLKDPVLRAEHMLQLRGVDLDGDAGNSVPADAETLMEVMEAREAISEATDRSAVQEIRKVYAERVRGCLVHFSVAFDEDDIAAASKAFRNVRYWINIVKACDDWPNESVTRE